MSKFTLALNSHALSAFQECEAKYAFTHFIGIEPLGAKFAMDRGSVFAKFLEILYYNRLKPHPSFKKALNNSIAWTRKIEKKCGVPTKEAFEIYRVMCEYVRYWKGKDWTPIAVERGFSKVIYEDNDNLFVWEGRPDLVAGVEDKIVVCDHKTQGQNKSIYEFNNQARGYLWAIDATEFVYNYIVFTKTPQFRREAHLFTPAQIEDWKSTTIEWFFRVKHSLEKTSFLQSWNCSTLYGPCQFHRICEQPKPEVKAFTVKSQFKKRKPYRSW